MSRCLASVAVVAAVAAACPAAGDKAGKAGRPVIDAAEYVDRSKPDCGLQQAIDRAAGVKGGAVVKVPEGTFALRRGLVLTDGVEIAGAGMDKTVLTPARRVRRLDVVREGPGKDGKVHLKEVPAELAVGCAVVSCRSYPPGWYGSPRPAEVTAIDRKAKTVTLKAPFGLNQMKPGRGYLTFGVTASLVGQVKKGDARLVLANASLLRPGDELSLGTPGNESMLAHGFVKAVEGNTVVLEQPARTAFAGWSAKVGNKKVDALIWLIFPMVHQSNVRDAAVRDLTIRGAGGANVRPMNDRYTLSGIHLYNAIRVRIERVAVRDWPADGISLQDGEDSRVSHCEATGCVGNGFHPGTGLKTTVFEHCLARGNGAGLYFCWHNVGLVLRKNRFVGNRGGGVTGLGNPGDVRNLIEDNLIADNGTVGIGINGGKRSANVIRNNVIENNSRRQPGKHPGIALFARSEDAREYTITGNTIRDTQGEPTQHVGVEERHGSYRSKPTRADENVIRGNRFSGHRKADVIVVGPATVVADNGAAKVVRGPAGKDVKSGK